MLFGPINAHILFVEMIDTIFKVIAAYIWFLDNILIHSGNTEAEQQSIVETIQLQYVTHELAGNLLKSKCYINETIFVEDVINGQQVQIDSSKVKTLSKQHNCIKKKEVQALVPCAEYYYKFIVNYSAKAWLLIDLTKDFPFTWRHT